MNSLLKPSRFAPVLILLPLVAAHCIAQKPAPGPTYAHDIRPILQDRCVVCHNRDMLPALATSGGLDLGSYEALKRGVASKEGARSIVSNVKGLVALIERISTTNPTRLMPRGGPPLPPDQIASFKKWIAAGTPEGAPGAEVTTASVTTGLPMPAPSGLQTVLFSTLLKASPDLVPKPTPKDLAIAFGLKVGPVPSITSLAYSPNGKILAVGAYRAVTLWNTKTGQPAACITHLDGPVQALVFRPDGAQLAIAGGMSGVSGEVRVVDVKTLVTIGPPLKGHTEVVLSVAWNAEGTKIATGSQDKTARVWEWPSGKELKSFKDHGDAVTCVSFSPDGKSLYTACMDHSLRMFDADKGTLTRTFTGHSDGVISMAVSLDGKRLISSGMEPNLRWWNTDTGDITNNNGGHSGQVNEIVRSKDGKVLISVSADKTARVWDVNSTGQQRALEGSTDWIYTAAISPDAKFTAAGGADGVVRIWETANGRLRLMLLAWPQDKAPLPEWFTITPEGYYDGSPAWCALLTPSLSGNTPATPQLTAWVKTLRQPDNLLKSWQGMGLDTAKPK